MDSEDLAAAAAFANGIALIAGNFMRYRCPYPPEAVPGSETDVQFALVTETGARFNVTVAYAGSAWEHEIAAMQEP